VSVVDSGNHLRTTAEISSVFAAAHNGSSLLVTGRAGTGKSTLLRRLRRELEERHGSVPVVAPTGIAALNVAGETLHRFFAFRQGLTTDLRRYRPPNHLKDVDAIIIDEISMVRADYFDMMSRALKRAKDSADEFGGVQVLLFGDLYQLPPVTTDSERDQLVQYSSSYFFAANAFRAVEWQQVELTEVFRQRNQSFISLLNDIRDGANVEKAIDSLNARVIESGGLKAPDGAIVLATTNRLAAAENQRRLTQLGSVIHKHHADVEGEVSLADYKVEKTVEYAVGAQVMMAVNTRDFVNGTLGRIVAIDEAHGSPRVDIELIDSEYSGRVVVAPHKWEIWRTENKTPRLVGSVRQLPFRLAWAVTVHRSQGQTFDNVVFDRGRGTFESGQLYVALSRCRTFEGLFLVSPLRPRDVIVNSDVVRYFRRQLDPSDQSRPTAHAYVGAIETDTGEYGRIVEIAVIVENGTSADLRLSTLVNPMRDMSGSPSGLSPSDLTLAPTIEELRSVLAVVLNGCAVVGVGSSRLLDQIGWSKSDVDEGVWLDSRDLPSASRLNEMLSTCRSAIDAADLVRSACDEIGARPTSSPVINLNMALQPGLTLLARPGIPAVSGNLDAVAARDSSAMRILKVAHLASSPEAITELESTSDFQANATEYRQLAAKALDHLIEAAKQDKVLSESEEKRISAFAEAFSLEFDASRATPEDLAIDLKAGLRVCLTGSPAAGGDSSLRKPELRKTLERNGMVEVESVTRRGCDLVVALDASSMSGKAKQARKFGIPVLSSQEFLRRL
jgi:ATP-dependent DNA helicase PIF1